MAKRERATPVVHDNGFTLNGFTFHVAPKYQPLDAIGQGSYGVVCSVKNGETGEKLAIKKITPMAGDEWDATHTLREIRLMRCLGAHENVRAVVVVVCVAIPTASLAHPQRLHVDRSSRSRT